MPQNIFTQNVWTLRQKTKKKTTVYFYVQWNCWYDIYEYIEVSMCLIFSKEQVNESAILHRCRTCSRQFYVLNSQMEKYLLYCLQNNMFTADNHYFQKRHITVNIWKTSWVILHSCYDRREFDFCSYRSITLQNTETKLTDFLKNSSVYRKLVGPTWPEIEISLRATTLKMKLFRYFTSNKSFFCSCFLSIGCTVLSFLPCDC